MSLSTQVFVGLGLGVAVGIFFGDLIAPIGVLGQAFILLLQMTVLPYVAVALVSGLGGLGVAQARALARNAGGFLLMLWGLALVAVVLMPLAFPDWASSSFFSSHLVDEREGFDFLRLFIPANPFEALAENVVPAVVVFSLALGIALMGIEGKRPLLRGLEILTEAISRITNAVLRLAPLGIFAIAAEAAGTLDLDQLSKLQVYVVSYLVLALILSLWVVPGLVTALTPFRYREVVVMARGALVTAFATGNVFVVLSVLAQQAKELLKLRAEDTREAETLVDVVVPVSFALPSAGKLLALSFVPFAGWLSGYALPVTQYPAFLVSGVFTFFGNQLVAVPFLLDMFRVPADTFRMFVIADSIVGIRLGALLAAMHTLALALLTACGVGGLIRVRPKQLARWAVVSVLLLLGGPLGVRFAYEAIGHDYEQYQLFIEMRLPDGARVASREAPSGALPAVDRRVPTLERIARRGKVRVGYRQDTLPWTFVNQHDELVGFDVEMMRDLARDLGVDLEFVRVPEDDVPRLLNAGTVDLAAGMAVTPERILEVSFAEPHVNGTMAFVVPDHRRHDFTSRDAVMALESVKIGVPQSPYYIGQVRRYLPHAEVEWMDSPRPFFRGKRPDLDAILYTAEAGSAWTLVYPHFAVAVPQPNTLKVPFAYSAAQGDDDMVEFLTAWVDLKRKDGTVERAFDRWFRGVTDSGGTREWSVIRNVLGWVD